MVKLSLAFVLTVIRSYWDTTHKKWTKHWVLNFKSSFIIWYAERVLHSAYQLQWEWQTTRDIHTKLYAEWSRHTHQWTHQTPKLWHLTPRQHLPSAIDSAKVVPWHSPCHHELYENGPVIRIEYINFGYILYILFIPIYLQYYQDMT